MHLQAPGEKYKINHFVIIIISGLLLLIVSCTNFINMLVASYFKRIKLINTKIVLGAQKWHLIKYSLMETLVYFGITAICILILNIWIIPVLSQAMDFNLLSVYGYNYIIIIQLLVVVLVYVLVSVFPAFILIWGVAKIEKYNKKSRFGLNNLLIVGQFALAIFIAISAFFMHRQISFALTSDLGYNSENILNVDCFDYPLKENRESIKHFLNTIPEVVSFCFTEYELTGFGSRTTGFRHPLWNENEHEEYRVMYKIGDNFFKTMQIPIISGRCFDNKIYNESKNIIINKTFAQDLGGVDSALNLQLENGYAYTVVGVCDDFYFESMHTKIEPLVIHCLPNYTYNITVKTQPGGEHAVAKKINDYLTSLSDAMFNIKPLQQQISTLYQNELNQQKILSLFGIISLLVSCMGLLGIVVFALERKTKEIGIRKVNGAKVSEIIQMLNSNFIKWVVIAFVIATPIAYYAMSKWLQNFAYKTELNWWIFALAGCITLIIALLTVSWQTFRAARRNPVEALRYE